MLPSVVIYFRSNVSLSYFSSRLLRTLRYSFVKWQPITRRALCLQCIQLYRPASRMFKLSSQCNRRLTCSPKRVDLTIQKRLAVYACANRDVFAGFCHHGDTICHPKSSYVTNKLNVISTWGWNNNAICSDKAIFTFPTVDVCLPR